MNKYAHLAPRKPDVSHRHCATKIRFRNYDQAAAAAVRLGRKRGAELYPYNCPLCLGWHNASRAPAA